VLTKHFFWPVLEESDMSIDPVRPGLDLTSRRIQRNFQQNQLDINRSLERLSSGLRVNRAADDPSGISRARRTETRLISAGQALNNVQEATLLAATASDSVQQTINKLQQMRSLVLESLNEITTSAQRESLQAQLSQLVAEIDRLGRSTEFNQRILLDGSASGPVPFRPAESRILFNQDVTDTSVPDPIQTSFITGIVSTDPGITTDAVIQFRLFQSSADFSAGLEVTSSILGTIVSTDNYLAFPNTYDIPITNLSGGPYVRVNLADLGYNEIDPLTLNEYQNVSLQQLVDDRRIQPVTYGGLDLTLGGVTYADVLNVQPTSTIEDVVNAIDGLVVGSGSLSASYDAGTQRVSVSYTNQADLVESTLSTYTPTIPGQAGGPESSFADLAAAPEGPAYRDPDSFLPAAPFAIGAPPPGTVFPSLPAELDSAFDFAGSDPSLALLGLNNQASSGLITGYTVGSYTGETLATGGQSEYVNRTTVTIETVSSENQVLGAALGLDAADANRTFEVLNTAQVNQAAFGAGDFSIDFGSNGVFNFAGFDPDIHTIQDITDAINTYASITSANVSASFDAVSNTLLLENTALDAKLPNPNFVAGEFTIDFGEGRIFDSAVALSGFDPDSLSLGDLVSALNGFAPGINVSLDLASGTLNLENTALDLDGNGPNNQVVFGGANGSALADLFNLAGNSANTAVLVGDTQALSSSSEIDNRSSNPLLALTNDDVNLASLSDLLVTGGNEITFGGPNGANLASFFQIGNALDTGIAGEYQSVTSAADISSQALDPSLDITPADVAGTSLTELMTPKLAQALSGDFYLNGDLVLSLDASTHTFNDLVSALNGFTGSGNQVYSANFDMDVAGGLSIGLTDTETLAPPGTPLAADPGGASPQVNGNTLTLDSAAYVAADAPLSYNGGIPLGSGSGPAEQLAFAATALDPDYALTAPDPSTADISGIIFSGSNIGSVLFLQNAASGTPNLVGGSDLFRGEITATGPNEYSLQADYQRTFSASSSTTSTQQLGYETPLGQNPEFGVVGRIYVRGNREAVTQDSSLRIQSGIDVGQTSRVSVEELTARILRLEGLNLIGSDDNQTYLRGLSALEVVDDALSTSISVLGQLGAYQRVLESQADGLALKQTNLAAQLSTQQDADLPQEIANLTRAQINTQAAAFALSEHQINQRQISSLLFGSLRVSGRGGLD